MKKIVLFACFSIFLVTGLLGQEIDFKISVDSIKSKPLRTLQITITQGKPAYTIYIFKLNPALDDPFVEIHKNKPIIKITASSLTKHIIPNLEKGSYYIEVRDNSKLPRGKSITF